MRSYIVFEHVNDPRGEKPIGVYAKRWQAEEARLCAQRDKAADFNIAREKAFEEGRSFTYKRTADDFTNDYNIKEVKQ